MRAGLWSRVTTAGDAGTVRYSIASGGNDTFGIDESTGLIVTVAPIDYETRPEYLLMVRRCGVRSAHRLAGVVTSRRFVK